MGGTSHSNTIIFTDANKHLKPDLYIRYNSVHLSTKYHSNFTSKDLPLPISDLPTIRLSLKGAMSRFAHLEKFRINFSSHLHSHFSILNHPLSFSVFLLPLGCSSTLRNDHLDVFFDLRVIKHNSKYHEVVPIRPFVLSDCFFFFLQE